MTRTRILILTAAILSFQSGHTAEPPECPGIETGFLIRARAERSQRPLAERRIRILQKKKPELLATPLQNVVAGKKLVAPSGDKHDYISVGTYWWPNPDTPDGLPYIRRDGVTNPDSKTYDNNRINKLSQCVNELVLLWYFTKDEEVAKRAVEQLRSFFLDPRTRMNPHLKYSQSVPGVSPGRVWGLIDTLWLTDVVNAAALLRESEAMTGDDYRSLQAWFKEYTHWLLTDPMTVPDRTRSQNHGLSYQLQIVIFSGFAGDPGTAKKHVDKMSDLIVQAIDEKGFLPQETARTESWIYSVFAMDIIMKHACAARKYGVDLLDKNTLCGQRIRMAAEKLSGYIKNPELWPHKVLTPIRPEYLAGILLRMHVLTGEKVWLDHYQTLKNPKPDRAAEIFYTPNEPEKQ
ncbi:MAG: alginate lyase family protein [Victivallales bacterium]